MKIVAWVRKKGTKKRGTFGAAFFEGLVENVPYFL